MLIINVRLFQNQCVGVALGTLKTTIGTLLLRFGSTAVKKAIENNQPLLGLHGHIHESRGSSKIGRTLCINPGSEYGEGILRGVLVTIKDNAVQSFSFTSG